MRSSPQDVLSVLQTSQDVEADSIIDWSKDPRDHTIRWIFKDTAGDSGGMIHFRNDKVAAIEVGQKEGVLTVADVISEFGPPEKLFARMQRTEQHVFSVYLLYPSKGYAFLISIVPFRDRDRAEVKADQTITGTWFVYPSLIWDLMTTGGTIARFPRAVLNRGLQDWTGYGEVKYVNWP